MSILPVLSTDTIASSVIENSLNFLIPLANLLILLPNSSSSTLPSNQVLDGIAFCNAISIVPVTVIIARVSADIEKVAILSNAPLNLEICPANSSRLTFPSNHLLSGIDFCNSTSMFPVLLIEATVSSDIEKLDRFRNALLKAKHPFANASISFCPAIF